jgi:uncharacterized protein YqeY
MTKQQLRDELKQAMLSRDVVKTSVLRMVLSAVGYFEIQKGGAGYEASDEEVLAVIQKEVKQHKDSIEQFKSAGRQELMEKETKELEILQTYLPAQMSEDEVRTLVEGVVERIGATSSADMGKVMSMLMGKVKGKADGSLVSRLVREELGR